LIEIVQIAELTGVVESVILAAIDIFKLPT